MKLGLRQVFEMFFTTNEEVSEVYLLLLLVINYPWIITSSLCELKVKFGDFLLSFGE